MTVRNLWLAAGTILAIGTAAPGAAQVTGTGPDYPRGRISGYLFGDFYYNVTGDPGHGYNASGADTARPNIDGSTFANGTPRLIGSDLNGVQIRRIYFQADNDLSAKYSTRFRLEMDSKALTSDGKIGVYVKAAYLQAKNVLPGGSFLFGMLTTPTFEIADELWLYRPIEKTIADFRGLGSSSDIGVQLKGYFDSDHRIGYSAMVGNGPGQKPEDNRYKKGYLSFPLRPTENLWLEPYADYEGGAASQDRATFKMLAGYEFRRLTIGAEVVDRVNHQTSAPNREPFGFSIFARGRATPKMAAFARFDRWQPNTRGADRVDTDMYIAGLDWEPFKDVHVMPNVEATQYNARGAAVAPPHHDLQARMTMYYRWSKP